LGFRLNPRPTIGGALALVLFVAWERRSEYPLMPMRVLRNRGFSNGCVASFVLMAGMFGLGFLTTQYLQLALHYNPHGWHPRDAAQSCLALERLTEAS
jgi:hypothetical protein